MLPLHVSEAEAWCCVVQKIVTDDADVAAISVPSADGTDATSCHCHVAQMYVTMPVKSALHCLLLQVQLTIVRCRNSIGHVLTDPGPQACTAAAKA